MGTAVGTHSNEKYMIGIAVKKFSFPKALTTQGMAAARQIEEKTVRRIAASDLLIAAARVRVRERF